MNKWNYSLIAGYFLIIDTDYFSIKLFLKSVAIGANS